MVEAEGSSGDLPDQSRVTYFGLPRNLSHWALNTCKEGETTASLDNQFECSTLLTVRKLFVMFKQNFLHVSVFHCSSTGHQRGVWLSLFYFLHQVFAYTDRIPSLLYSRLSSPSSLSLSPSLRCSNPSLSPWPFQDSLQHVHVSPALGNPVLDPASQMCLFSVSWEAGAPPFTW